MWICAEVEEVYLCKSIDTLIESYLSKSGSQPVKSYLSKSEGHPVKSYLSKSLKVFGSKYQKYK